MQLFGYLIVASVILNFGSCDKECPFDSGGPNCQFKNIAHKEQSRHNSNINPPHYSERANDNSVTTCSYTSDKNDVAPWWNLWLSEYTTFKKLEFVTVDSHLSHFPDFEVTVYNTTEANFKWKGPVSGGQVCYNHNNSKPQSRKIHVTCNGSPVGNLIRVQLQSNNFQLILCDFRLYGDCFNGFYGNDCQKCSDNCESSIHQYCDSKNGHCLQGCKPGWKGDRCETKCENGMWGQDCRYRCGKCDSSACDHITGECPRGCHAGYKPPYCTTVCDNGFFGKTCKNRCNDNCLLSRTKELCDYVNGTCLNGCKSGYQGSQCSNICETGKWGHDCRGNCGNCVSSACDHITGECPRECSAGFKPPYCTTVCDNGFYGKNCSRPCSSTCYRSSSSSICNNVTGTCLRGCKAGYEGSFCEKECDDGKWGSNCTFECGKCDKSVCNRASGVCEQGCAPGFISRRCNKKCDDGKWGMNCTNVCGKCFTSPCNHENGYCQDGCAAGYKKTWDCHSECEDGTYGNSCLFICSDNCKGICNRINGTCDQCRQFWTGHFCEKVSDRILRDREESTRCQETPKLNIAFICVGILCVIFAVYATVITNLFKRKATQNGKEETSGGFSGRTKDDAYVNETNKTEPVTYEQATEATNELAGVNINATDDESHQYTDLTPDTKDVEATYETIQLE